MKGIAIVVGVMAGLIAAASAQAELREVRQSIYGMD